MIFDTKYRLEKKIALMNAEFALIIKVGSESMAKAYRWYCIKKCIFHLINTCGLIILSVISPMSVIDLLKNMLGG